MDSIIQNLNKCILFNHLSVDELCSLLSDITYNAKFFAKNEVIFSPHLPADTLGIVLNGSIDVQKIFASGKSVTVNRRFQYELIADAAIFANIPHYPATISACENSHVFLINKMNLLKLFSKDEKIMAKFLESVSNRILALNTSIEILSINSVPGKIAYFLLRERNKQSSDVINLSFTKKTLAEHLNVSRPTLSRELKNMQSEGIISFHKRTIEINNLEKLEELCSV
jgi:CRP/FNR family transcriptional regulator, dissimilatory nitrate respiration regulator